MPPGRALRAFRLPKITDQMCLGQLVPWRGCTCTVHSTLSEVSQAAPAAPGSPGLVQVSCLTKTDLLSSVALEALVVHINGPQWQTQCCSTTQSVKSLSQNLKEGNKICDKQHSLLNRLKRSLRIYCRQCNLQSLLWPLSVYCTISKKISWSH